jgi:hypothetical protein
MGADSGANAGFDRRGEIVNREMARKVADAVLYEGYMLYPYRPSAIKNRQRWSFGTLYPAAYHEVQAGTERSGMHSECLLKISRDARLQIEVGFLHLCARAVAKSLEGRFEPASSLIVDGASIESWDEGIERSALLEVSAIEIPQRQSFSFAGNYAAEEVQARSGSVVGRITRRQQEIAGAVSLCAEAITGSLLKLAIDLTNETPLPSGADRNSALLQSFLSAHIILTVSGGEFVSLLDPPDELRAAAQRCKNIGNFPVLLGAQGERDMLLCSPILLYDYPQIAPESAGDFYDGTEMDEMLTLRVMTLTDDEKNQMRLADHHAASLLQRTEQTAREQLMRTHGVIRSLRPVNEP